MAKYIPTRCPKCGNELCLMQPALKNGETQSIVKDQCLLCMTEYEYVLHVNKKNAKN